MSLQRFPASVIHSFIHHLSINSIIHSFIHSLIHSSIQLTACETQFAEHILSAGRCSEPRDTTVNKTGKCSVFMEQQSSGKDRHETDHEGMVSSHWDTSLPQQLCSGVTFPERLSLTPKSKKPPFSPASPHLIFLRRMCIWYCVTMYFFIFCLSARM